MTSPAGHAPDWASVGWFRGLNFSVAQVQLGIVPFIALFLQSEGGWSTTQVGAALAFGNLVQLVVQTPAGALIDRLRRKRLLLAGATLLIALGCSALLWSVAAPLVWASQGLMGLARAVFPPALSAVTLGMFGKAGMDRQTGVNQSFNAAGSIFTAGVLAAAGYWLGLPAMFYAVLAFCLASLLCIARIRGRSINFEAARGNEGNPADGEQQEDGGLRQTAAGLHALWRNPTVRRFLVCAVLFDVADAAMVPLVSQLLGQQGGSQRALLMTSAYTAASQVLLIVVAPLCGRLTGAIGRKPLLLFAFVALVARAGFSAWSDDPTVVLIGQCSDALSTGVFGVIGVLIVADLTRNTGAFNLAFGALATVQGLGSLISNAAAGYLAEAIGKTGTFAALAFVAMLGALIACTLSETREMSQTPRDRKN